LKTPWPRPTIWPWQTADRSATEDLFAASRRHSNQNLANMATKIKPRYGWDDIVLPADTFNQLQEMVNMVRSATPSMAMGF
jgi:hypothetical protein